MDHIELLDKLFDENADPADYVFEVAEVVTDLVEKLKIAESVILEIKKARDFRRPSYIVDEILNDFYARKNS